MPLKIIIVIPTPRTAPIRSGGSTKFGGAPLGFSIRGMVDRSMPGGRAAVIVDLCFFKFWGCDEIENDYTRKIPPTQADDRSTSYKSILGCC
jgi:hypothetical protein